MLSSRRCMYDSLSDLELQNRKVKQFVLSTDRLQYKPKNLLQPYHLVAILFLRKALLTIRQYLHLQQYHEHMQMHSLIKQAFRPVLWSAGRNKTIGKPDRF